MASLRPSAFNQRERSDGGPFLIVEPAEDGSVDVLFTDVPVEERNQDSPRERLLNVCPDYVSIWPLNVRQDREDYLQPRYGSLANIIITRQVIQPYELPTTTEDVEELLAQLPDGFSKDFRFGLGLLWEYRSICETIADLEDVNTLWLHGGREVKIEPPFFIFGEKRFHALRRELNSITSRYQRDARKEKLFSVYQTLLHGADAKRYPAKKKKLRPDALAEMTHGGRDHTTLSKGDQRAAVRLVQDSVKALAKSEPNILLALKSDIEQVTLQQLIERYQEMLGKGLSEAAWQVFFMTNPFVLSLAFAVPVMLLQGHAYVGGKRLDGTGGKITDFLLATASTGNLALVEIKKPGTELFNKTSYRDDVYGPSADLGGAITQVLDQRLKLQKDLPAMKDDMDHHDIHSYAVRCIVVAGMSPQERHRKKSFELIRNALSDVVVITFDELCTRLTEIHRALLPPDLDNTALDLVLGVGF